jgi:hypothetical protein
MDSYLENAMDYAQEAFESANEWMKENDPFPLLLGANAEETGFCNYRTEQECKTDRVYDCSPSTGSGLAPGSNCGWKYKEVCHTVYVCK